MEVKIVIILVSLILGFIIGFFIGKYRRKKLDGGTIEFSKGETGPKCTFKLNCDTEEFMQKMYVVFKVIHTNDNSENGRS